MLDHIAQRRKELSDNIQKSYNADFDTLEKGKRAEIGEIRTWGNEKWVKHQDGWVHVHPNTKRATLEKPGGKRERAEEHHTSHYHESMEKHEKGNIKDFSKDIDLSSEKKLSAKDAWDKLSSQEVTTIVSIKHKGYKLHSWEEASDEDYILPEEEQTKIQPILDKLETHELNISSPSSDLPEELKGGLFIAKVKGDYFLVDTQGNSYPRYVTKLNKEEPTLEEHARNTPTKDLERTVKEGTDGELRTAAHKELERRKGEEKTQPDPLKEMGYSDSDIEDFIDEYSEGGSKLPKKVREILDGRFLTSKKEFEEKTGEDSQEHTRKQKFDKLVRDIGKLLSENPNNDSISDMRMLAKKLGKELGLSNQEIDKKISESKRSIRP